MSQADLHAANKQAAARGGGAAADLDWHLEYSFKAQFGLSDMSVGSFEALAHRLASNSSANGTKQWVRSIYVQMCVCGGGSSLLYTHSMLAPPVASECCQPTVRLVD